MGGYLSTLIAAKDSNCVGCVAFCPVGLQVKFSLFVSDDATDEQIISGQEQGYLKDIAGISNQQIAERLWRKIEAYIHDDEAKFCQRIRIMQKQFTWKGDKPTFERCCERLHSKFALVLAEQDELIDESGFSEFDSKCTLIKTQCGHDLPLLRPKWCAHMVRKTLK